MYHKNLTFLFLMLFLFVLANFAFIGPIAVQPAILPSDGNSTTRVKNSTWSDLTSEDIDNATRLLVNEEDVQFNRGEVNGLVSMDASANNYSIAYPTRFYWIDSLTNALNVTSFTGYDQIRELMIPFSFQFYGSSFSSIYVTSMGWMTLDHQVIRDYLSESWLIEYIPNDKVDYLIAPLWSYYLQPIFFTQSLEINVTYSTFEDKIIVEYLAREILSEAVNKTQAWFQVILFPNGTIFFSYRYVNPDWLTVEATEIGLNRGDLIHYTVIPNSIITDVQNVTVKLEYPVPQRDLSVGIGSSHLYQYLQNNTYQIGLFVTNTGTSNVTEVVMIQLYVNGFLTWSQTMNGTLGEIPAPGKTKYYSFTIIPEKLEDINLTLELKQLDAQDALVSFMDDVGENNRAESILNVTSLNNHRFSIQVILAASSFEPLPGVNITFREKHGLVSLTGVTDGKGMLTFPGVFLIYHPSYLFIIEGVHSIWSSEQQYVSMAMLKEKIETNESITLYFGPGYVEVSSPCESTIPVTRGYCLVSVTIMPYDKIDRISAIVASSQYMLGNITYPLSFQVDEMNNELVGKIYVARFSFHVPVFKGEKNNISVTVKWNDGTLISRSLLVNGSLVKPLFSPNLGDWMLYRWPHEAGAGSGLNDTMMLKFVEWLGEDKIRVSFEYRYRSKNLPLLTSGDMVVNIYNGYIHEMQIKNSSLSPEQVLPTLFLERFFFFTGLSGQDASAGNRTLLDDWMTEYEVLREASHEKYGDILVLYGTPEYSSIPIVYPGYANVIRENGLVFYFNARGQTIELLNSSFFDNPANLSSPEHDDGNAEEAGGLLDSLFNRRIPSFELMVTTIVLVGLSSIQILRRHDIRNSKKNSKKGWLLDWRSC